MFLPVAFVVNSCKPEPQPPPKQPQTYNLFQEGVEYCFFNVGTWWVYRDSASGVYDTVTVLDAYRKYDTTRVNGNVDAIFEQFRVNTESSFDKNLYDYKCHMSIGNQVRRVRTTQSSYIGEIIHYVNPSSIGNKLGYIEDIAEVKTKYDSIILSSNTYKDIIKFTHTKDYTEGKAISTYYLAKNIGIVRKEAQGKIWNLLDFNIVK